MEELRTKFLDLSDEEKVDFLKTIMPVMCKVMGKDPQKFMAEMMPYCREIMKECGMDMNQMMNMMQMMGR